MLISVERLHLYIDTELSDEALEGKLQGLELMVRSYTHNNFQQRNIRSYSSCSGRVITGVHPFIIVGDTIEISNSKFNNGVYNVVSKDGDNITVNRDLNNEDEVLVTRVFYPEDIVMGAVNLIDWDINRRDKVGVQSETISRHSVTYFNMDGTNSVMGFPTSLLGFLEPYRKARF